MQCFTCNLSSICKIFQMINDTKMTADVTVSNCKLYNSNSGAFNSSVTQSTLMHPQRLQRTPEQLNAVSELIKEQRIKQGELPAKPSSTVNIKDDSEEADTPKVITLKKVCSSCEKEAKALLVCSECGASICDGCSTESIVDGKSYCETCWEKGGS